MGLKGKLEVFIITNGRSTFEYAHKCIENQTLRAKITVISHMKWVEALNHCVDVCESKYYMRVDDDFLLHPETIKYMWSIVLRKPQMAALICKLWEPWTKTVAGGVKIYNTEVVKELGGFTANRLGKVDKPFNKKVRKSKYRLSGDKTSVVGIHSMGTWAEQLRYEALWSKMAKSAYKKTTHKKQKKFKKNIEQQYKMVSKFIPKYNARYNTKFHEFIKDK